MHKEEHSLKPIHTHTVSLEVCICTIYVIHWPSAK